MRARREVRFAAAASARDGGPTSPQTNDSGKASLASSDMNQNPLASPSAAESQEPRVIGAESGAAADVDSIRPKKDASRARCPRRSAGPATDRACRDAFRVIDAARSSVRSLQARPSRTAGSGADLLVRRLRVPEEVAGRVDADHHRAVDALRVAPGVDHRRAGARALADEVDRPVAERNPCGLEIVDPLRERVAGEIDAVGRAAVSRTTGRRRRRRVATSGRGSPWSASGPTRPPGSRAPTEPSTPR